jgi:hypothetical protein
MIFLNEAALHANNAGSSGAGPQTMDALENH